MCGVTGEHLAQDSLGSLSVWFIEVRLGRDLKKMAVFELDLEIGSNFCLNTVHDM